MHDDAVVITGLGAVTPLGMTATATWEGVVTGRSGIRRAAVPGSREDAVALAAVVPEDPADHLTPVEAKRLDRSQQFAVLAAAEAWRDAGEPEVDGERLAVAIGTGIGGVETLLTQDDVLEQSGTRRVSPRVVPMLMPNGAAAQVSIAYGARAGSYTPVSACSSGAEALALAARLIRSGEADVVIAGGTEAAFAPITIAGFQQARALSTWQGDAADASRPFAADRAGFVLGEGAALLVVERAAHARQRGARIYAELAGAGIASDAHHITAPAPDGAGQITAMRKALAQAELAPGEISHVNAHATGTPVGDAAEANGLREVFGDIAVTAPKAGLGHLFGAAGAIEALIAVLSVHHGVIPPTRNLETPGTIDPALGHDVVTTARHERQAAVLSNSFGFGGQNVSLVFTEV